MNLNRLFYKLMFLSVCVLTIVSGEKQIMAVETTNYSVVEKTGDFELRQYFLHIVAETLVEGDFENVGNEGFRRLAAYIKGNNRKKQSIAMTSPASQTQESERIPMTAPVNQQKEGEAWRITFTMPARYTMETLPEPMDRRIVLREVPGQLVAAIEYSGTWSRKRYEENKEKLESFIREKRDLQPVAEPIFARYNPPFMPWFLRRNEVLIPVQRIGN